MGGGSKNGVSEGPKNESKGPQIGKVGVKEHNKETKSKKNQKKCKRLKECNPLYHHHHPPRTPQKEAKGGQVGFQNRPKKLAACHTNFLSKTKTQK